MSVYDYLPSAVAAKDRLRAVIAADRAQEPFRNGHWQDRELRKPRTFARVDAPQWLSVYRWRFNA